MNAVARAAGQTIAWPRRAHDGLPLALWNAAQIAQATGGRIGGLASGAPAAGFEVSGVEIDSRQVRNGDLFVALKGAVTDGHRFVEAAFARGAAAALVEHPVPFAHVLVADCAAALAALARRARERGVARIVGVTGSVGKTGVKEAIFAALERGGRGGDAGGIGAHRSVKSYNNHVGVPLSLARMPARSRIGVFEMGMNHAGEISALSALVRPHVAVITAIAPAHIENLGSMEAIADAKAEIFEGLEPGGVAIIPADSEHFEQLRRAACARAARVISFGRAPHADVRLLEALEQAHGGTLVTARMAAALGGQGLCYNVAEPGEHWVNNSLCVMAAVFAAGGDLGAAGLALGEMGGLRGRGARSRVRLPGGHALLIDESYNANPASMRATLAALSQTPAGRRIAVLGEMKELGDFAPGFHAQLAEPLRAAGVDFAVLVGEQMAHLVQELEEACAGSPGRAVRFAHCADVGEAIAAVEDFGLASGDAVLVKGSNSVGLARLVDHFSAREG